MHKLEIDEIDKIIDNAPVEMNLMFLGDTGIGKTTKIEKYANDNGYYLKTLILSQLEASETLGIPIKTTRIFNGREYPCLTTAIPEWVFELKEHDKAILFLDEFLCAQPSVMNSFLNFLSQKRVKDIDLRHVRIIAATNIGNYTFEPDNNILSRFCWFYVINTKVNEYLNDKTIINDYADENEQEGVIFESRSLKPRCHEQLLKVKDPSLLQIFYEGFTNRKYILVHLNSEVNEVISPFFEPIQNSNKYYISDENIINMVQIMKRTFTRYKKWDKVISDFINIELEALVKIQELLLKE